MTDVGALDVIIMIIAVVIVGYGAIRLSRFMSKVGRHVERHLDDDNSRR